MVEDCFVIIFIIICLNDVLITIIIDPIFIGLYIINIMFIIMFPIDELIITIIVPTIIGFYYIITDIIFNVIIVAFCYVPTTLIIIPIFIG